MTDRYLIVGLGNPGREYEATRHNVGFRCVEALASANGVSFAKKQSKALVADGTIAERKVLLAKPQTYMNLSGDSVQGLIAFYKIPLANLLVISDDMDIPVGTLRIREKGSSGGQNGLKNIIDHLGTQDFARIRIGVGRPPGRMDPAAYILQAFHKDDEPIIAEVVERAIKATELWLTSGINLTMTRYNGSPDSAKKDTKQPVVQEPPVREPEKQPPTD